LPGGAGKLGACESDGGLDRRSRTGLFTGWDDGNDDDDDDDDDCGVHDCGDELTDFDYEGGDDDGADRRR
jgi:hypothetical protein